MRHQKRLLAAEVGNLEREGHLINPFRLFALLRHDERFGKYMSLMFLLGGGNLMLMAPLIVILNEHMHLSQLQQMMITSSIPLLVMPFAIPAWARLLDTRHVIHYRAKQSWAATVMIVALLVAVTTQSFAMLWVAAVLYGVSQAGGMLGWNIGHHDFAPPERAAQYMSVHMTLTGMRGMVMPLAGVALYQLVEFWSPGNGPWMMVVPLALNLAACIGFVKASRFKNSQNKVGYMYLLTPSGIQHKARLTARFLRWKLEQYEESHGERFAPPRTLKRLVSAPVFRLKGGGWYAPDFKSVKVEKRNLAAREEAPEAKPAESKEAKPEAAQG
jgi:MFS family permease